MKRKGVSLIVLVITIVVIIILAAAVILTISNNNPIANAKEARQKSDAVNLKEEIELEFTSYKMDESISNKYLTVSEKIEKLKENGILNEDMTFKQNSKYTFTYGGNIRNEKDEIVANVDFSNYQSKVYTYQHTSYPNEYVIVKPTIKVLDSNKSVAIDAPEGYKFAYWVDKFDNIRSFGRSPNMSELGDDVFIPVYVKNEVSVERKVCVSVYGTSQTVEGKLVFRTFAEMGNIVDRSVYSVYVGTLATNNPEYANESYMVATRETDTESQYKFYNRGSDAEDYTYYTWTWSKTIVGSETWYVRGYALVTDKATGETQVYYSKDIISEHK